METIEAKQILEQWIDEADIEITINVVKKLLATAKITLKDLQEITGFKVIKSQYDECKYKIYSPQIKNTNTYYLKDKELRQKLENRIIEAYESKLKENKNDEINSTDDIKIEDISL
ncbi:MAG: hypothetical protein WC928_04180 [Patescibacteria group bacterium]|jgi:phage major head subunit gpT-like protein